MIHVGMGGEIAMIVGQELDQWSQDVAKACYVCTDETLQDMVDELKTIKSSSFSGKYTRPWKKFPRAWTYEIKQKSWGSVKGTVHLKKPMYRIGHLLEKEHASRNGGRTVSGSHFIEKTAQKYEKVYEEKMIDMIGVVA